MDEGTKDIALGVGGTGLIGFIIKRYILPIVAARTKKVISDDDVSTKANESLVKQVERLEEESIRLSEQLSQRDKRISEEIEEKNKLLNEIFQLRKAMGTEAILHEQNKELLKKLDAAEARIHDLEKQLKLKSSIWKRILQKIFKP